MMSGRIAGTVHSHNRGGSYVRRFSIPVNGATQFQQNVRGNLADASQAWRSLLDEQRAAWVAWASTHPVINRLGASIILTGQQAYVALNRNGFSADLGANFYDVPPPDPAFQFPFEASFVIDADATGSALTLESTVQPSVNTTAQVFASPPLSAGRTFAKDKSKFIGTLNILAATAVPATWSIETMWVNRFGTYSTELIDKKLIVAVRTFSNGQWSGLTGSSTIIV